MKHHESWKERSVRRMNQQAVQNYLKYNELISKSLERSRLVWFFMKLNESLFTAQDPGTQDRRWEVKSVVVCRHSCPADRSEESPEADHERSQKRR